MGTGGVPEPAVEQRHREALDELRHALAAHDYRAFVDAQDYGYPTGCCVLCLRDKRDRLHLGRDETVQSRIDAILGRGVIEVRGFLDEKAVVDRLSWIERYAATHPADPDGRSPTGPST
jgi:hypothetical protein